MNTLAHLQKILATIEAFHATVPDFEKAMHRRSLAGNILYTGASYSAILREAIRHLQPEEK